MERFVNGRAVRETVSREKQNKKKKNAKSVCRHQFEPPKYTTHVIRHYHTKHERHQITIIFSPKLK